MDDQFKTTDKYNRFDEQGREVLNPTPMQPPLNYKRQPSLSEQIRQQILQHKYLEDNEPETEEEADDFEIEEDPIQASRWENDMIPSIKETRARLRALEEQERRFAAPASEASSGPGQATPAASAPGADPSP